MLLDTAVDGFPHGEGKDDGDQKRAAGRQDAEAEVAVDQPEQGVQAVELQQAEDAQQVDGQRKAMVTTGW